MIPRALVQRWWLPVLAGVAGIVLIAVTILLVREWRQRFPVLAPGVYRGLIQGIGPRPIGMLVERLPGQSSLHILLNSRDFQPVQATPVPVNPDEPASAWLPLLVPAGSMIS